MPPLMKWLMLASELLVESHRMYQNLGLIGTFHKGGALRSSWRLGQIMRELQKTEEAEAYEEEVREGWEFLKLPHKTDLCEADFNILLNYSDS